MIQRLGRTEFSANRWAFHLQAIVFCILVAFPIATAEAQVWIGSCIGHDSPISDQTRGAGQVGVLGRGLGLGYDIGFRAIRRWQADLFITAYASGLDIGNDSDPLYYLSLSARRRWLLADPDGFLLPFASAGLGIGLCAYVQGELGIDLAPNQSVGLELGIRDRVGFPVVQSAQVFLLLRIGRIVLPRKT